MSEMDPDIIERSVEKAHIWLKEVAAELSRSVALPTGIEAKKIKAKTHDGVVEVTIPLPKEPTKAPVTITPTAA